MPDIELKDLNHSIGTELFTDEESFLEDLTDEALNIVGGAGAIAVNPILNEPTAFTTTVYTTKPDYYPQPTPPVIDPYNPNPGGNSGINCTGFYTTGPLAPRKPRRRRPHGYGLD
jgi:hypothetical protein